MIASDAEVALKWLPISDFPHAACQQWRIQTDSEFRLIAEGDFYVGSALRTLVINFDRVHALAAHDDMGGMSMMGEDTDTQIPRIADGRVLWPAMKIKNSRWLAATNGDRENFTHFALLSYECTVEVIGEEPVVFWKQVSRATTTGRI